MRDPCKHVLQYISTPCQTFAFVSECSVLGNLPFTDTAALPNPTGTADVLTCSGNCSEVAYLYMVQGKPLQASCSVCFLPFSFCCPLLVCLHGNNTLLALLDCVRMLKTKQGRAGLVHQGRILSALHGAMCIGS